jgi:YD repeat-containing protein
VTEGATTYVSFASYNALGQPGTVTAGNGVTTALTYHNQNFRLLRRLTTQGSSTYQDLRYGYDPGGNEWQKWGQIYFPATHHADLV